MNIILKSLPAIMLTLTAPGIALGESAPKQLEFAITSATNPTGKGGYSGTVAFTREDTKNAFKVTWTLSDGSTQTGWGVPYPGSGFIAVAYGSEAVGVAIYKLNGEAIDGRWALAKDASPIDTVSLKRGKVKHQYVPADSSTGSVSIVPSEVKGIANVTYELAAGKIGGVGIAEGDYMAIGTATGQKDFGVVIYQMNKDLTAAGKWIVAGAPKPGTENLKLVSIDGQKTPAAGEKPVAEAEKEMDNADLAKLIAVDVKKCAAVGEYFLEQMKLDDMDAVVGLMDDRAFNDKFTRDNFSAAIRKERGTLGKMKGFTPDKKKVDFKAAEGGGMNFTLEGDGEYEKGKTREVFQFHKPKGADKVVLTGYSRKARK